MSENPSISAVIPVRDRLNELVRALTGIRSQTKAPFEVIIVDDGSTLPVNADQLSRMSGLTPTVIRHDVSKGAAIARNAGIKAARGEVVALLDSDDFWSCDYVKEISKHYANPNVVGVATGFLWCDDRLRPYRMQCATKEITFDSLIRGGNFVGGCSVLSFRRAALIEVGGFSVSRGSDDWDLLLKCSKVGKIERSTRKLVYYRSPSSAKTETMTAAYRRQILAIKGLIRRHGALQIPEAAAIRRQTLICHLANGRRWGLFWRCLKITIKAEGKIHSYMVRPIMSSVIGPENTARVNRVIILVKGFVFRWRSGGYIHSGRLAEG